MKKHKLIGGVLAIVGVLTYIADSHFAGISMMTIGFGWFIVGRMFD